MGPVHLDLTQRLERLVGARIESFTPVVGGYTPALRLVCRTATTSFFAKIGATPLTSQFLRREIDVYTRVTGDFMPRLIACEDDESAPILIIKDLSSAQWPPPWDERRVELVLAQIHAMHGAPVSFGSRAQAQETAGSGWAAVAENPGPFLALGLANARWLDRALPHLIQHEARRAVEGESLTHWDLRSDNICVADGRVLFVDWNHAGMSNLALDLGFWLPSLAYEGGPLPERILPDAPEVAAWVSGFSRRGRACRSSLTHHGARGAAAAAGDRPALGGPRARFAAARTMSGIVGQPGLMERSGSPHG